jgi:hypothetical protein
LKGAPNRTTGRYFCRECSGLTEFIIITVAQAQKHYLLSKNELDELVELPDARIKRRGRVIYYPRIEVLKAAADAKMAAMNTTLAERRQKMMQETLRLRESEMRNRR